ncbi:hypothetical protein [Stenotrophomonas rhizophila]
MSFTFSPEQARANADAAQYTLAQYYADLNYAIEVNSQLGLREITFGFKRMFVSETQVDQVISAARAARFEAERLTTSESDYFIRIGWQNAHPVAISA